MGSARLLDGLVFLLMCYFMLMNVTVERSYCPAPITRESTCFLCQETVDFCEAHNPLFLERPEWMRLATCFSAYGFLPFYAIIALACLTDGWKEKRFRVPILLFLGAKLNALLFYHAMEFLSHAPPQNLVAYFGVEGPYLVSIALVLNKIAASSKAPAKCD